MDHFLYKWRLLRHILSKCELFWVSGTLFWVGGGEWECMGHYFGCVRVSRTLFWVGGGGWKNILVG